MAILTALMATLLLTALGVAIAMLGSEESMLSLHERSARALRQAASAGAQLAVADLRLAPSWDPLLALAATPPLSAVPGRFLDSTLTPPSPWSGVPIDLAAATAALQAATMTSRGPADAAQAWRLYLSGPLARAAPSGGAGPWYVAVWIADDKADTDGDPTVDSNGLLSVHAVAYGPADAAVALDLTIRRLPSGGVGVATSRPGT
jgi:hypothetical protein